MSIKLRSLNEVLEEVDNVEESDSDIKYYKDELNKIGTKRITVKLWGDKGETKTLNVNKDFLNVFKEHFNI